MKRRLVVILIFVAALCAVLWWGLHKKSLSGGLRPAPASSVVQPPVSILVDDFETGTTQGLFAERKNRLDAFQGTWARRPSFAVITKVPDSRQGKKGNALRIEYSKQGGWCGWYTLLNGIDVSRCNALTFWVKGERGGERFDIGLADQKMQELEIDAVFAGPAMAFLPKGVTTGWQQIKIPLASLRSDLDLTRMGSLVLWFRYEGSGAIQIDDVGFVWDKEVERILEENVPRAAANPKSPRASWVWKYDPVSQPKVREELFSFCRRTALLTLYIYFGEEPVSKTPAEFQKSLADFLRQAHAQGLSIHALQGNPRWALAPYHALVEKWVQGYLDFNAQHPLKERIDGVHLDIEPYLTTEWEKGDKEAIKAEFVELVKSLSQKVRSYREKNGPFELGLAIPLFYNREPEFEEALLSQVDYAALMDYYDSSVDIIQNGRFHLDMARRLGKKIVIGVETQDLVRMGQGKRRNTFHEEGWQEMEAQLNRVAEAFAGDPSFTGIAIHAYDSYRLLQRGRNVPTRERSSKIPPLVAPAAQERMVIDGNLSEWKDASWTAVDQKAQVLYGVGAWKGPQDMSFKVAARWSPEALYVAVDVTDDLLVQEKRGADMWEGDHIELWVDVDLEGDYNEAVNSTDDFQIGLSPGNFNEIPPEVYVWVPSVAPSSIKELVDIAAQKTHSGYTLEVRLPMKFLTQTLGKRVGVEPNMQPPQIPRRIPPQIEALQNGVLSEGRLKKGFRMGLMVDGSDCDEPRRPQKCLLSTSPERQWGDPTTFNVVELQ